MTRHEKISYAKENFGAYMGFPAGVFEQGKNVFLEGNNCFFEIVHFGENAVIRANIAILDWCVENFSDVPGNEIMDGEHLCALTMKLREHGKELSGQDLCFLHLEDSGNLKEPVGFELEIYENDRLAELYEDNRFPNALNYDSREEVLAIVARKNGEIVAMTACDDYYKTFRQIGIDTLAKYRGKGLAAFLVKKIALEIESRGQVPLYATWGANIASVRTALAAGFSPVWVWYYAVDAD